MNIKVRWLFVALLLTGCGHPLHIEGQGDIVSSSGQRNCQLEEQPCNIVVVGAYQESYSAQSRAGFTFSHWEGCPQTTEVCTFDVDAETVKLFWGQTSGPLVAVFVESENLEPVSQVEAALFLQRATFGPKLSEIESVASLGYKNWLAEQLNTPTTPQLSKVLADAQALAIDSNTPGFRQLGVQLRMDAWWNAAINGEDQLRQRVAFALSQIFVVADHAGVLRTSPHGFAHYADMLAEHAFGNYRDLMEAVTLHPVMGEFLSMRRNEKANPDKGIFPDENYAREIMQLFTIGLKQLNQDGSLKLDADGQPILTYDNDDILEFAKIYTGWNYADATKLRTNKVTADSHIQPMKAFEDFHETSAKTLLNGQVVPAGQTAQQDLDAALDNLFNHSNTPPFVAMRLIERLVSSNPSPAYVKRVADVFVDNGNGERGDLAAVITAILLDEEALTPTSPTTRGKLKEPILRLAQLWRAFDAQGEHGELRLTSTDAEMGQRPYSSPSVFNFFQPSYSPSGPIRDAGLKAPEFQILTEVLSAVTTNRLFHAAHQTGASNTKGLIQRAVNVQLNIANELALANDPAALVAHLNLVLLGGSASEAFKARLQSFIEQLPKEDGGRLRVDEAISLIVTSPQFAIQL